MATDEFVCNFMNLYHKQCMESGSCQTFLLRYLFSILTQRAYKTNEKQRKVARIQIVQH